VVCCLAPCAAGMSSVAASLEVDQAQINRLLLDLVAIGERHGIRFPRKQGGLQLLMLWEASALGC